MAKHIYLIAFLLMVLFTPCRSNALDALDVMGAMAQTVTPADPISTENNTTTATTEQTCGNASSYPIKSCDKGSGFLCVSTPEMGITETYIRVSGTIDVQNNQLGTISASIQNEYSNSYNQIKFDKPDQTTHCKESSGTYCLDDDGFFSLNLPLGEEMGPYSIAITATRANGDPSVAKVRTSRIVPVELKKEDITITNNGSSAQIMVDMLKGCAACDFIGTSTGAVNLTVVNTITGDGGVKTVTEKTNMASGGAFALCMQLGSGTNTIKISACNEANGATCPTVELAPIVSNGTQNGFAWLSDIKQFYSADMNPEVQISFKLGDEVVKSCEESNVLLLFNREAETKLCPDASGTYNITLKPSTGINVGSIYKDGEEHSFSFGWGDLFSPFETNGTVKDTDKLWIDTAGGFVVGENFLTETLTKVLNNFLRSDEFKKFLTGEVSGITGTASTSAADEAQAAAIDEIRAQIPRCSATNNGGNKMGMKITSAPDISKLEISAMEFGEDIITATLSGEDIRAEVNVLFDVDKNGVSHKTPMPLIIGFKEIEAPIDIKIDRSGDEPLLLLTGRKSDCDYLPGNACKKRPAIIAGKEFRGNVTKQGGFVKCDSKSEDGCKGINILNRDTGILTMSVLDAINEKLYCDGSAALTYFAREKMKNVPIAVGCPSDIKGITPFIKAGCTGSGMLSDRGWIVPVGLNLMSKKFKVTKSGISGEVPLIFGSTEFFANMPAESKRSDVGFIRKPDLAASPELSSSASALGNSPDFGIAFGLDMINSFLFVMNSQKIGAGLLDWEIDEVSMKKMGLDIIDECYVKATQAGAAAPSAICQLKPRVADILGSAPTTNGYLEQNQPLRLRFRGNRAMPPRLNFFQNGGKQFVELQLGDVELSIFVLAVDTSIPADANGNLTPKVDENGNSIIVSSNPLDQNPENGALVKFNVSAQIALEVSDIANDPSDTSKFAVTLRPDQTLTRIIFKPIAGGNTTLIPETSMISALQEKINYGINIYSDPAKAFKLSVPKEFVLGNFATDESATSMMGLKKLLFGKDGLKIMIEDSQEYLDITGIFNFVQTLTFSGKPETFTIPE